MESREMWEILSRRGSCAKTLVLRQRRHGDLDDILAKYIARRFDGLESSVVLFRLRWRFWHSCCIVCASSHVGLLNLSGDHLEYGSSL